MASIALIAAKELQKKSDAVNAETLALKAKTSVLENENIKLKAQNDSFKQRLSSLEKLVTNLASGQGLLPVQGKRIVLNK